MGKIVGTFEGDNVGTTEGEPVVGVADGAGVGMTVG